MVEGRTTRVPTAEQPRLLRALARADARFGEAPVREDTVARDLGDDGCGGDDREERVRLGGDGEVDGWEEGRELGLVVGGGADRVDVALWGRVSASTSR